MSKNIGECDKLLPELRDTDTADATAGRRNTYGGSNTYYTACTAVSATAADASIYATTAYAATVLPAAIQPSCAATASYRSQCING